LSKVTVLIRDIAEIHNFVHHAQQVEGDVICTRGRFQVDGKSIMGLFSIDTADGFIVEYPEEAIEFGEYLKTIM